MGKVSKNTTIREEKSSGEDRIERIREAVQDVEDLDLWVRECHAAGADKVELRERVGSRYPIREKVQPAADTGDLIGVIEQEYPCRLNQDGDRILRHWVLRAMFQGKVAARKEFSLGDVDTDPIVVGEQAVEVVGEGDPDREYALAMRQIRMERATKSLKALDRPDNGFEGVGALFQAMAAQNAAMATQTQQTGQLMMGMIAKSMETNPLGSILSAVKVLAPVVRDILPGRGGGDIPTTFSWGRALNRIVDTAIDEPERIEALSDLVGRPFQGLGAAILRAAGLGDGQPAKGQSKEGAKVTPDEKSKAEAAVEAIDKEAFTALIEYFNKDGEDFSPSAALDTLGTLVPDELLVKFLNPKALPFARKAALRKMLVMVGLGQAELSETVLRNVERVVLENQARAEAEEGVEESA